MDLDGETEWINGGKFYLSNWNTPSNGITASFEARDALVFLSDSPYTGRKSGTLYEMCYDALELLDVTGISYFINESLKNYSADFSSANSSYKNSDVLQLAANAAGMALYQTRDGQIRIDWVPFSPEDKNSIYEITEMNDFEYPEISFSNKLKNISYSVNNASKTYPAGATGDGATQSISNALLSDSIIAQPKNALTESYKVLSNRRTATLSYRASPHNDALDFVKLNHQFGYSSNLLITDVKYTFNGCFKGSVTGYMIEDVSSLQLDRSEIYLHPSDVITLTATLTPASADSPVIIWNASPSGIVELNVAKNERGVSVCNVSTFIVEMLRLLLPFPGFPLLALRPQLQMICRIWQMAVPSRFWKAATMSISLLPPVITNLALMALAAHFLSEKRCLAHLRGTAPPSTHIVAARLTRI